MDHRWMDTDPPEEIHMWITSAQWSERVSSVGAPYFLDGMNIIQVWKGTIWEVGILGRHLLWWWHVCVYTL